MRSRPTGAALAGGRRDQAGDRRQPALQHRHAAADRLARDRALAALVGRAWSLMFQKEVAERIVARARRQGLWPARRHRPVAHARRGWRSRSARRRSRRRPAVASAVVEFDPDRAALAGMLGEDAGDRHGRRVRPAPQDAAPEPQGAARRSRGAARRRRHRSDLARARRSPCATSPGWPMCWSGWAAPSPRLRAEGQGEGWRQTPTSKYQAAPHPDPLPILKKNGERELLTGRRGWRARRRRGRSGARA